jgi:hypothetical protein
MNAEELKALQAPIKERYRDCIRPVGSRDIRLRFDLDTDAWPDQRKKLIELTT